RRDNFDGPIALTFAGLPPRVSVPPAALIATGRESWAGALTAAADAEPGTAAVTVQARAGKLSGEATFHLTVTKPPPPLEKPPPPPAAVSLQVPAALELQPGGRGAFRVGVRRENFKGPVQVRFEGRPAGVTARAVVVAEGADEARAEVVAGADAAATTKEVRVIGTGDRVGDTATVRLTVRPAPPQAGLELSLPGEVV